MRDSSLIHIVICKCGTPRIMDNGYHVLWWVLVVARGVLFTLFNDLIILFGMVLYVHLYTKFPIG